MENSNNFSGIGQTIKTLREEKGLTQAELAKKLNVKRETVNQWENEVRDLKTQYTISLAKEFDVSADFILGITQGVRTKDITIKQICKYTGLSEKALNEINTMKEFRYYFPCFIKLIESRTMRFIVTQINSFLHDKLNYYEAEKEQRRQISKYIKESLLRDPEYVFRDDDEFIDFLTQETELTKDSIAFQSWKFQQDLIKVVNAFIDDYVEVPKELEVPFYKFLEECNPNAFGVLSENELYFPDGNKKSIFEEGEKNGKHNKEE